MAQKVLYRVPLDPACPDEKYVRLWLNGKLIEIQRNVSLELPQEYIRILEDNQIRVEELSQDNLHISNDDSIRSIV